jgi:hypothetical protein
MSIRKWLTSAFSLSALGVFSMLGSALTAPQAYAQPPASARSAASAAGRSMAIKFPSKICLFEAAPLNECITSHGAGNQVDIETSDQAVFHTLNANGNSTQLENAAGNCLREFADGTVGLANGGCDSTNLHEYWKEGGGGTRETFQNASSDDFMGTFQEITGSLVMAEPNETGLFSGWTPPGL